MSKTDKLDRNPDRMRNAWIVNGVPVAAKIRNALIPSAADAIAESLADAQPCDAEYLLDELASFDRYMDCEATPDPALVDLFSRPRRIETPRTVRPATVRVQHVLPSTFVASEGRVTRIGASRGKHHADMGAGQPQSLMALANARAKALGL